MSNSPIQKVNPVVQKSSADDNLATNKFKSGDRVVNNEPFNSRKVFGNILSLGTSEIVARGIAFFGIAFLARRLGPEGFGIIGFATAVYSYLALAVTAGFNDVGAREVASRPTKAADTAVNVIFVRFAVALIIFAVVGLIVWVFEIKENIELVVLLMSLSLFSLAIDTSWAYKGLERNHRVGVALVLGQILFVGTLLIFVKDAGDILIVPLAQFFGEISVALLLLIPLLIPFGGIKLNLREGWRMLRSSGYLTVTRLLRAIIYSFDVVLIGFWLGEREVGLYTAPYRICFLFVAIAAAIHISYLPSITRAFAQSIAQAQVVAERAINLGATIAAPMIVGGMILAAPLLDFIFGAEYVEGAAAFRLLLLSIGFIFIHGANHHLLLVSHRTKTEMKIYLLTAAINVGLNLIFIRRYGITGAAAITALAEVLTLLMGFFVLYKAGIRLKVFRMILPPLIASLLMGAVLFALDSLQMLFVSLAVGDVCYLVFLVIISGMIQGTPSYRRSIANFAGELRKRFL
jgi:O-antigen/teichoic acid export membrane protein